MIRFVRAGVEAGFQADRDEFGLALPRQAAWPDVENVEAAAVGYAMPGTNDAEASGRFCDRRHPVALEHRVPRRVRGGMGLKRRDLPEYASARPPECT